MSDFVSMRCVLGMSGCAAILYLLWRRNRCKNVLSGVQIYETNKAVDEYLLMHFGEASTLMPWKFGPEDCLEFPKRCANLCMQHMTGVEESHTLRALDVGCAVGRSAFELTPAFDEVVGIDFSEAFIQAANTLKMQGSMSYRALEEGQYYSSHIAEVPQQLERNKAAFEQGDACNLRAEIGLFDCVLASNLICRLPDPRKFLRRLSSLVWPGGIVVITSPYTFLDSYTVKEKWLGGYVDSQGKVVRGFDTLKMELSEHFDLIESKDMPFLIRETARKNQWTVSHATVWKRKFP